MKINKVSVLVAMAALFTVSCSNDDDGVVIEEVKGDYQNGILITNEGPFNNGSGTVTYISNDSLLVKDAIFKLENNEDLGNILQSIAFDEDRAYIVVNNSHKIHVVNRYTFKSEGVIEEGLLNPRYLTVANGKGYVTNWGDSADETDDYVAIIDLETNTVSKSIPTELGPEAITSNEDFVYVAHQGAFGQNNKVSIIDASTDVVSSTLTVGDFPNSMQWDTAGNLWVLSSGAPEYTGEETNGTLTEINTSDNSIVQTFNFETTEHPGDLSVEDDTFYFGMSNAVYTFESGLDALPTEAFINDVSFYSMTVNDGKLYGTDAKDYASKGDLFIYDLNTKELTNTISVGIIPGGIYFN
ncbi:YncE family protein [Zobellia laminariae]|uniref:YncE family protein n=1 Tax=Zobellia laminariae TaxID=248906 RepID=UPI003EF0BAE8